MPEHEKKSPVPAIKAKLIGDLGRPRKLYGPAASFLNPLFTVTRKSRSAEADDPRLIRLSLLWDARGGRRRQVERQSGTGRKHEFARIVEY
jgi:hypothetical protein